MDARILNAGLIGSKQLLRQLRRRAWPQLWPDRFVKHDGAPQMKLGSHQVQHSAPLWHALDACPAIGSK